ncbi:MAG: sigma 54-interacting transcriptional regulator [Myxococcota bacterium]
MSHGGTRILRGPAGEELVLPHAGLRVLDGPHQGTEHPLRFLRLRIGSNPDNDLILPDDAVSGVHAELDATPDGWRLRDLGSTNGTFLEGIRVREAFLAGPSRIRVGATRLEIYAESGEQTRLPLSRRTNFGSLLGHSPAMRSVFATLEKASKSSAPILLLGESGTGKEVAARALHEKSDRRAMPYVVFDCGAASPTLVESQLFGHAKGAFTGAAEAREGVFEAASGGTLVLDEIGELPVDLQPKFLRILETGTVRRLGEVTDRPVDVRLIACTHRNLQEEIRQGRFREDLFFRLSVLVVHLPPLRDRPEEIPRLVQHFLSRLGGPDAPEVGSPMMAVLQHHRWPGNVRELRNFVERLLAFPQADPASLLPSGEAPIAEQSFHAAKQDATERFERAYLARLLAFHGDNISEAARVAGLSRQTCYRLMKKHGLESSSSGDER